MSSGELSFESPTSLSVTWAIPDFSRLVVQSGYFLRSPDFTFADDRYCLRLFHTRGFCFDYIEIESLNLTDTDPERAVLYEVHLKSRNEEIDFSRLENNQKVFRLCRTYLEREGDLHVPGGTFTVLCSLYLREPGNAGSPKSGGARKRVIPKYRRAGSLSFELFPFLYVTWKIPGFFQLARPITRILESPEFPFSDRRYRLRLNPHEYTVLIYLLNLTDKVTGRYASSTVGLKSKTGEEIDLGCCGTSTTREFRILRSALDAMQPACFPDGHLTLFCCLRAREATSAGSPLPGGAETPGSKSPVPQAATRPKSSGSETSNEEEDKERLPGISMLSSDLRQLLQKMPDSDACLVVSGKEFRAHQIILRARSKVFEAMFGHETAERNSGRVVIDDLDPDSFGDFLEYLYTGAFGAGLSDDNAFGLYEAADKYDVPTLKAECVSHMRGSLSVDSFCDVLAVALRHPEEELFSQAVLFFKENMPRIILTSKWQQFAIDNGKSANELFIKAFASPRQ